MDALSEFLTIVYYQLFRFERLAIRVLGYPSDKLGLALMKYQFKRAQAKGKNLYIRPGVVMKNIEEYEEFMRDFSYGKRNSLSSSFADTHMFGLFAVVVMGTACYLAGVFHIDMLAGLSKYQAVLYALLLFLPPTVWLYWRLIDKKNQHLKKWSRYEKNPINWHRKTAWMAFFVILGIWAYGIGGFAYMLIRL